MKSEKNLHYIVSGNPAGEWLTLSHSLATNLKMWDSQLETLEKSFRLLRYDAYGHGSSTVNSEPMRTDLTMSNLIEDVIHLWDELNIRKSHFVGLSMGGMTGAGLALNHPEKLEKLVLCDCRLDAPRFFLDMWDRRIELVDKGGMSAIVEEVLSTWVSDKAPNKEANLSRAREFILNTDTTAYIACANALKTLDYKKSLHLISTPVLYLVGDDDGNHPPEMQELANLTPSAALHTISNAAHLSNLDQVESFNSAIIEFLSE